MTALAELQTAVQSLLERVAKTGDPSLLLDRGAVRDARRLAALLSDDDGDLLSRHLLGWLYWYRYHAQPEGTQPEGMEEGDLWTAVDMLVPLFVNGADREELPDKLLPILAEHSIPTALDVLEQALTSPDPRFVELTADLWKRIAEYADPDYPNRAMLLANLGIALQVRADRTGKAEDLDEAVERLTAALEITEPDDPDRPGRMNNLGGALRVRYELAGEQSDQDDLDEAIRLARAAVDAADEDHADRPGYLNNLALALGRRGTPEDQDTAVDLLREALRAVPGAPMFAENLAQALRARYERTKDQADLDEVAKLSAAAEAEPDSEAERESEAAPGSEVAPGSEARVDSAAAPASEAGVDSVADLKPEE
ncbi:hypothetical protein J5X84_40765 [Streptosporangiaceae bacterium NEAU-GS5]|nr:hypothetical protein [Streptosporangiaceae bacterium NEAU-GS5]